MACTEVGKEHLRDMSQIGDNRSSKRSSKSPIFSHKQARQPVCIEGLRHALWAEAGGCKNTVKAEELCVENSTHGEHQKPQDCVALVGLLKACAQQKDMCKGSRIHADIVKRGLLQNNIFVGTALLSMYAKCSALAKAREVFEELPTGDVVPWNALITGYAQQGLGYEALECFERMLHMGLSPNAVTFICILKACGSIGAVEKGKEIHAEVDRQGLLATNTVIGTALVDMYAKCGMLAKAHAVFDELPIRSITSWNALITGYNQHGLGDEAVNCFKRMQDEDISPDAVTFVCVLKAYGSIGAVEKGEEIHVEVGRQGLLKNNILLGTALMNMYAKCGALVKAQEVFDELPARDVPLWNALIAGYAQHGLSDKALKYFGQMGEESLSPNAVTFVCILKACGNLGAEEEGSKIHTEVRRQGLLEKDLVLGTALVDMYAKCGALAKAQEVFDKLQARDVTSWTALMAGYAQMGKVEMVFDSFSKLIGERIEPNMVTFIVLLNSCNHEGLVEKGQAYFHTMRTDYCIIPSLEHYTCMVDLFSRAGHFDKAISIIEKLPPSDCLLLWLVLLNACREKVNIEVGRWAFEHAVCLDVKHDAAYVCMSNLYAVGGMHEEAGKVEALRRENGALKIPGQCWWIDASRKVHLFNVGVKSHPHSKHAYAKLRDICQKLSLDGDSRCLHWMSPAISNDQKKPVPCEHTELLAILCALINTPEGTPIHVTKNMRICHDCHFATSLVSKMENRKIQVKDANYIHIFEGGQCGCDENG